MSKEEGKIVKIKFSLPLTADIIGSEKAFTLQGKEYAWVNGPDNNGPLVDKTYAVLSTSFPEPIVLFTDQHNGTFADTEYKYEDIRLLSTMEGGA